jgi:hypothetical protein
MPSEETRLSFMRPFVDPTYGDIYEGMVGTSGDSTPGLRDDGNNGWHEELEERRGRLEERGEGPRQGSVLGDVPRRIYFGHGRENELAGHILAVQYHDRGLNSRKLARPLASHTIPGIPCICFPARSFPAAFYQQTNITNITPFEPFIERPSSVIELHRAPSTKYGEFSSPYRRNVIMAADDSFRTLARNARQLEEGSRNFRIVT